MKEGVGLQNDASPQGRILPQKFGHFFSLGERVGMGQSIWNGGGPKMQNPPPYMGINSANPPQSIG